jgi:hypothetical protein
MRTTEQILEDVRNRKPVTNEEAQNALLILVRAYDETVHEQIGLEEAAQKFPELVSVSLTTSRSARNSIKQMMGLDAQDGVMLYHRMFRRFRTPGPIRTRSAIEQTFWSEKLGIPFTDTGNT